MGGVRAPAARGARLLAGRAGRRTRILERDPLPRRRDRAQGRQAILVRAGGVGQIADWLRRARGAPQLHGARPAPAHRLPPAVRPGLHPPRRRDAGRTGSGNSCATCSTTYCRGARWTWSKRSPRPIPIRVLGHIMGIPAEHHDRLVELGDRMLVDTEPGVRRRPGVRGPERRAPPRAVRSPDAAELCGLGRRYYAERRDHPQDDVMSLIANAASTAARSTHAELDNNFAIMVVAGNETTRQAIALGTLALIEHPDQLAPPARQAGADDDCGRGDCCASPRRSGTSAAPRPATPRSPGRRSAPATRSSSGSRRPTATPTCSPTRTASTWTRAERSRRVRPRRPALLPRRAPRAAGDAGAARGALAADRADRTRGPARARALELRERPAQPAGAGHGSLSAPCRESLDARARGNRARQGRRERA